MIATEIIKLSIESLDRQIADWEKSYTESIRSYCTEITVTTSLTNIFNVVNHASEIKKLKFAKEELKRILWMIEMQTKCN